MKTDKRKIFGFGAVVLMILVALSPSMNGIQLQIDEENNEEITASKTSNDRLVVGIISLDFKEYTLLNTHVRYELDYWIGHQWTEGPVTCVLKAGDHTIDTWEVHIPFSPFYTVIKDSHIIKLRSSENPGIDEERLLVGKTASLEIRYGIPCDIDYIFVKHWRDDNNYVPTEPQVGASTPCWYKKTPIEGFNDIFTIEMLDVRVLPSILKSERLGWIANASKQLFVIVAGISLIVGETGAFLYSIENEAKIVLQWIVNLVEWFANVLKGVFFGGFAELINNFFAHVRPAIKEIKVKAALAGAIILPTAIKLLDDIEAFYDWRMTDPWTNPISIEGEVNRVKDGETVTVSCRDKNGDKSKEYYDSDGDGTIKYKFDVTSEPIGNEKYQYNVHDCQVTVGGSKHDKSLTSPKLLSYVFSDGILNWTLAFPSGGGKNKEENLPVEKQSFIDKIRSWFESKPLISFFKNILGKIRSKEKVSQTSIERDFDLDGLMAQVIEKEKQQSPYEGLVYKEYFPGAPRDPNIVYYSSDQVLVGFISNVDVTKLETFMGHPVVDCIEDLNIAIVEVYGVDIEEFIQDAEERDDVEFAEVDALVQTCHTPNDPYWDKQWGPKAINCPKAWDIERGFSPIKIAIIDTGVDYSHEDIRWSSSSWKDFVDNDNDPMDEYSPSHGTHCAGIALANMGDGCGIAGVAPDAGIMPVRVLDRNGAGSSSVVAKGIVHAAKSGAYIISMSLGGYGSSLTMRLACEYAYFINSVIIFAAAGNDGMLRILYPARYDTVIAVGAVDENLERCHFSNYGPELDLVAPGENIYSTLKGDRYGYLSGTSMATPHAAAVAALYYSADRDIGKSPALCKGKLFSTAKDLGDSGKDWYYGYGLVNAYEAVKTSKSKQK